MISIIICSVNSVLLKTVSENITSTIGVEHEIIAFDNRGINWGICKVYNHCASISKYPFLCFIHEDMILSTHNWGDILMSFYNQTESCGVIGFAGGQYVSRNHIDWEVSKRLSRISCRRYNNNDTLTLNRNFTSDFEPAIIIDGMFLFVQKNIWALTKFDEDTFNEFHLYDSDFSFNISQKYNNFVCGVIDNTHLCVPKFNKSFCNGLLLFHSKWKNKLPFNKYSINTYDRLWTDLYCGYRLILTFHNNGYNLISCLKVFKSLNSIVFFISEFLFLSLFVPFRILSKFKRYFKVRA